MTNLINEYKAGSPTDPKVFWIHLQPKEIAALFFEQTGYKVSNGFIKRLLKDLGFKYRKLSKNLATGHSPYREQQFQVIFDLVLAVSLKTPIISIDCKKKERLGKKRSSYYLIFILCGTQFKLSKVVSCDYIIVYISNIDSNQIY